MSFIHSIHNNNQFLLQYALTSQLTWKNRDRENIGKSIICEIQGKYRKFYQMGVTFVGTENAISKHQEVVDNNNAVTHSYSLNPCISENCIRILVISDFVLQALFPTSSLSFMYKYFANQFQICLANGQKWHSFPLCDIEQKMSCACIPYPANTTHLPNVCPLSTHRLRRRPNIGLIHWVDVSCLLGTLH